MAILISVSIEVISRLRQQTPERRLDMKATIGLAEGRDCLGMRFRRRQHVPRRRAFMGALRFCACIAHNQAAPARRQGAAARALTREVPARPSTADHSDAPANLRTVMTAIER
jgi:hypothetical protein